MYVKNVATGWISKEKVVVHFYRLAVIIIFNPDKRLLLRELLNCQIQTMNLRVVSTRTF